MPPHFLLQHRLLQCNRAVEQAELRHGARHGAVGAFARLSCAAQFDECRFYPIVPGSTHQDISNPNGMPNLQLLDFQIRQVAAYLMSLR